MSVLSNLKLLKNIKRDKKLLKSCYKLDKTLKTAQVYMHKNSKYLDSNIFIMLFKRIAKNTDKILPNDCKITKPLNFSSVIKDKPKYPSITEDGKKVYYKPMYYEVKKLFIKNAPNSRKLYVHTAGLQGFDFNYHDYDDSGHGGQGNIMDQTLQDMGYLSTKDLKLKGEHEKHIKHNIKALDGSSFMASIIGLIILFGNQFSNDLGLNIFKLMTYVGWTMFIAFGLMVCALSLSYIVYDVNHMDTNAIAKDTKITEGQFTVIINHIMSNNNKVIDKTFKNLSLCRKDYHLNLSPEEHLKDIKNNGTSWNDAVQKANE